MKTLHELDKGDIIYRFEFSLLYDSEQSSEVNINELITEITEYNVVYGKYVKIDDTDYYAIAYNLPNGYFNGCYIPKKFHTVHLWSSLNTMIGQHIVYSSNKEEIVEYWINIFRIIQQKQYDILQNLNKLQKKTEKKYSALLKKYDKMKTYQETAK